MLRKVQVLSWKFLSSSGACYSKSITWFVHQSVSKCGGFFYCIFIFLNVNIYVSINDYLFKYIYLVCHFIASSVLQCWMWIQLQGRRKLFMTRRLSKNVGHHDWQRRKIKKKTLAKTPWSTPQKNEIWTKI